MNGSFTQFVSVLRMNLSGLPQRLGLALTIIIGVTCAVGVLVSMLAMGVGARRQTQGNSRDDRVILTSIGAQSTMQSSVSRDEAQTLITIPGIRLGPDQRPVAAFEVLVMVEARKKQLDTRINFPLVGVTKGLQELRPEIRLTAGRLYQPGLHEMIASDLCAREYTGFEVGDERAIRGTEWTVVGHFSRAISGGTCLVYADADSVMSAFDRNSYNQVTVMLQSPAGFDAFRSAVSSFPTLRVEVQHERDVLAQESRQLTNILDFSSFFVGTIMAVGATLGGVNSLYAIVDSRRRDLATLRAIGYDSGPLILAIVSESIILALPGALMGAALAWAFFNGLSASPMGVSFQLAVTPLLAAFGLLWAFIIGVVAGLPPALRAAHLPITVELRAT
jgi:putative ABC transport system permease protein